MASEGRNGGGQAGHSWTLCFLACLGVGGKLEVIVAHCPVALVWAACPILNLIFAFGREIMGAGCLGCFVKQLGIIDCLCGLFGFEDVAQAQAALGQAMPDPLMLQEQEKKRQQREKPAGRASILLQVHARACRVSFRHITLLSISISATFFYNFSYPLQYNRNC